MGGRHGQPGFACGITDPKSFIVAADNAQQVQGADNGLHALAFLIAHSVYLSIQWKTFFCFLQLCWLCASPVAHINPEDRHDRLRRPTWTVRGSSACPADRR